jgi:SAM-dependent methyltransferase
MEPQTQEAFVAAQFGAVSAAYVASPVHATGADLARIAEAVRGRGCAKLLDMGCGGGHVSFAVAPHVGEVTAVDLSSEMLRDVTDEAARRGLANIVPRQASVEQLPYADARFDAVVSRFSAHHWRHWRVGLAEARRVLKPGGLAIFVDVVTPDDPLLDTNFQGLELLRDPSHVRNHTIPAWREALAVAGFSLGTVTPRRLHLEFSSWVARIGAPPVHVAAIRSLQHMMSAEVRAYFEIQDDGSFTIDTASFEAV